MPKHFHTSFDGALQDTRDPKWAFKAPLRAVYSLTFYEIRTAAEFKATLRAGDHAWPGGYPMYLITSGGDALCYACGRKNLRCIIPSIATKSTDGWRVVATKINWEGHELACDQCGERIESAYGED